MNSSKHFKELLQREHPNSKAAALLLLELTAAFDVVDHDILQSQLESYDGLIAFALQ